MLLSRMFCSFHPSGVRRAAAQVGKSSSIIKESDRFNYRIKEVYHWIDLLLEKVDRHIFPSITYEIKSVSYHLSISKESNPNPT